MANEYPVGVNRIFYRSTGFIEGRSVKVTLIKPDLSKILDITLTEFEEGLYYFDFYFTEPGIYVGLFYEDGVKVASHPFLVTKATSLAPPSGGLIDPGRY